MPYWTSKKVGQGTGLGLAVVQALVHANGGRIVVTDAPGGGALFDVVLPRQGAQAGPASAARTPTARRLLVVDDDPAVRTTIVRQAERHGWSAVEAPSGERALELLLASGSEFDAVVCDLRMPGLSGMGLYEEVRRREPALLRRLLFLTGDMSSAEAIAFVARCNAPLFGKPFRFGDLLGRLREITGSA